MWGRWWSMWPYMSNVESGVNNVLAKPGVPQLIPAAKRKLLIDRVSCRHVLVLFLVLFFYNI